MVWRCMAMDCWLYTTKHVGRVPLSSQVLHIPYEEVKPHTGRVLTKYDWRVGDVFISTSYTDKCMFNMFQPNLSHPFPNEHPFFSTSTCCQEKKSQFSTCHSSVQCPFTFGRPESKLRSCVRRSQSPESTRSSEWWSIMHCTWAKHFQRLIIGFDHIT